MFVKTNCVVNAEANSVLMMAIETANNTTHAPNTHHRFSALNLASDSVNNVSTPGLLSISSELQYVRRNFPQRPSRLKIALGTSLTNIETKRQSNRKNREFG
jgi:hypothetical protein